MCIRDRSDTDLRGANLNGVRSGNIFGFPSDLPVSWQLINGYLVGPGADLSEADLSAVDLRGTDLRGTDLSGTDLSNADLGNADLTGASLSADTNFSGAVLTGVTGSVLVNNINALQSQLEETQAQLAAAQAQLAEEFTLDEIIDLRPGSSLIAVADGNVTLSLLSLIHI